ncbi:hypothetical protein SUGI_1191500 [Cryptomeria japonica]|uniref:uncharacterized protein LOC131063152 n=1 Tax=Cryptomeria japonica TaxID=3369 RepID=UPI002414CB26|nr:uncharacterized protein LOC131063152 [Cryptomeria japonica]GLJ55483.1 hypothetical protein SUGI_1191500 [Cryptomeria japonica]
MDQTIKDDVGAGEKKNGQTGVDQIKKLGPLSRNIIPHILNLYCCAATGSDFEIYHPNATFEDFYMRAYGVKEIKSVFYSVPKIVSEGKIVEYSVKENETSPGCGEILIDNKQIYKFLGKTINMTTLIVLQVENGKIIRHEDRWDVKPFMNRHTVSVPLLGRVAEGIRRCSVLMVHVMMGFGKDPTP